MRTLAEDYETLFGNVGSTLTKVNGNWSQNLANNFTGKINTAQRSFQLITRELMNGAQIADTSAKTFESVDSGLTKLYCDSIPNKETVNDVGFFESGLEAKLQEYLDIINGKGSIEEKKDAIIKWLNSIRKDANKYTQYIEWATGVEAKYPEPIKSGLSFIKYLDIGNKLGSGLANWADGIFNGDAEKAHSGGKNAISGVYSLFKDVFKSSDLALDFQGGLILDYGKNMVTNWLDSIQTETKVSEVYWNTFANSAIDVFDDTVCNTPTLAIAYLPAKGISSLFGYDLQAAYENVSDKKGFAAVTDTFSQMGELFKENSTWENWKSGMSVIGKEISGFFSKK